jgi:hypothetical protein
MVADGKQSAGHLRTLLARQNIPVAKTEQRDRYSLLLVGLPAAP